MTAALTIPNEQIAYQFLGNLRGAIITVTLAANDYVTGGIDLSTVLPSSGPLHGAIVLESSGAGGLTQIPVIDRANKKLVLLKGTAGANAEVSNGSSDAQVVRILALTS